MSKDEKPPNPFDPDARPRGILTKKDRKFLIDQEEYDAQTKRDKRYRIRNRVVNAYLDFNILTTFLPDKDRNRVFERIRDEYNIWNTTDAIIFTYSGLEDLGEDFEPVLKSIIENHERSKNPDCIPHVTVDIDIRTENISTEDAINRFVEGEATFKEFNFLMGKPEGLHQLADKIEETDTDAKMEPPEEDAEPATIDPEQIRDLAKQLTTAEEKDE